MTANVRKSRRSVRHTLALNTLVIAERSIRAIAGRLHLPAADRLDLLRVADALARALKRNGLR